jgi:hypothetical protein
MNRKLFAWIARNERHLSTAVFVGGFAIDNIGYTRVDLPWITILFSGMLMGAALCILIAHVLHRKEQDAVPSYKRPFYTILPIAAQFFIGGLLSGCLIFYTRSASIFASWPFILLLFVIFLGNEIFHKYRERLTFQCILFFFTLYMYAIFELPIARGAMNSVIFVESGLVSVVVFSLFLGMLWLVSAKRLRDSFMRIIWWSGGILVVTTVFYFIGVLPPLPLALKDAGVYHSIVRAGTGYDAEAEADQGGLFATQVIHHVKGTPIYGYSSVFAPIALTTPVVHRWERYQDGGWVTVAAIAFPISGGRDSGYRGYSMLGNPAAGAWRLSIETENGAVLGRVRFTVEDTTTAPAVYTQVK